MPGLRRVVIAIGPALALVVLQVAVWPVSWGVWLSGLILGGLSALVALGMSLIYRASNAVTFAQADLGMLPATAAVVVMSAEVWNWPYWLAMPLGIVAAALIGGAVEMLFIRRFFAAPRLVVTVATVGIAQLLGFASLYFPQIWGLVPTIRRVDPPFEFRFTVGAVVFGANDLLAAIVAPVLMLGLGWFLTRTETGTAIRAAASAPDRASMLGVPVRRLQTQVWMIAGVFAFVAVFFTAGITGLPPGSTFTFLVLVRALAALVLGGMTRLVPVASCAVALGILQNAIERNGDGEWVGPLLLIVILVALLARQRGRSRLVRSESLGVPMAVEARPVPAELAGLPEVRAVRWALGLAVAAVAIGAPLVLGTAGTLKAGVVLVFAVIGLSMVVLAGWAGQVSLGQMAFVGSGGAITAWATVDRGWDPIVSMTVAAIVGAVLAVAIGLPALRLRGLNLAIVTLALAVAASGLVFAGDRWRWIPTGAFERPPWLGRVRIDSPKSLYYLALMVLLVAVVMVRGLRQSRVGRVLVAVRDNEAAAASFGIGVTTAKLTAFACSGSIAAVAGSVYVFHQAAFIPDQYLPAQSVSVFIAAVIGGLGTPMGAVLGAVYLRGAQWILPGSWQILASAAGVLLVLIALPDGLAGAWFRSRDFLLAGVARRRGIEVPSLSRQQPDPEPEHASKVAA